jgi:CRP/FNR family transcriptional regulator, cyclic AMP receptor protein
MNDTIATLFGFLGAGLMLASYMMKAMLPLRLAALAACVCLVAYGALKMALPTLLLYAALIPINVKKMLQLKKLIRDIETARADSPLSEWLLPHMTRRTAKAGDQLWRKGDLANEMIYLQEGVIRLEEYGELVQPGALLGEIGMFAPDNRRTLSLRCESDCVIYGLSSEAMQLLYFQSPKLGYHVVRLIVARLMRDKEAASAREQVQAA